MAKGGATWRVAPPSFLQPELDACSRCRVESAAWRCFRRRRFCSFSHRFLRERDSRYVSFICRCDARVHPFHLPSSFLGASRTVEHPRRGGHLRRLRCRRTHGVGIVRRCLGPDGAGAPYPRELAIRRRLAHREQGVRQLRVLGSHRAKHHLRLLPTRQRADSSQRLLHLVGAAARGGVVCFAVISRLCLRHLRTASASLRHLKR